MTLRRFGALVGAGMSLALLSSCTLVKNYDDPDGPRYFGNYSADPGLESDPFTLLTFNIEFGEEVARATREIRESSELERAGVVLLQEMDSQGVDEMARELGYDYVYYPGSVNHGKDFGNAVLSRWPIVDDEKLILPHRNPTNGRIRIAVGATLDTPSGLAVVFSVHSDTAWLGPRARLEQAQAIIDEAERFEAPVAIGGDFNTLEDDAVEQTVALFERAGYAWATAALPPSTASPIGNVRLDHVFVKGFDALESNTQATRASDHQPVWVKLERTASL